MNKLSKESLIRWTVCTSSVLVILSLVFVSCRGININVGPIAGIFGGRVTELTTKIHVNLIDLIRGTDVALGIGDADLDYTVTLPGIAGLRVAFILLLIAVALSAVLIYGIVSKKMNTKTIVGLGLSQGFLILVAAVLFFCAKQLVIQELVSQFTGTIKIIDDETKEVIYEGTILGFLDKMIQSEGLKDKTVVGLLNEMNSLGIGSILLGSFGVIAALGDVCAVINYKKNIAKASN